MVAKIFLKLHKFYSNLPIFTIEDLWPECKFVHGKPRHPQSQGSVERVKADIRDMTVTWMRENNCKKYPKSALLHQSLFLISMATEQQILSYDLGKP
jgi:hypothetical protein